MGEGQQQGGHHRDPGDPATQGVEADPADENTELNPFERGPEITEVR